VHLLGTKDSSNAKSQNDENPKMYEKMILLKDGTVGFDQLLALNLPLLPVRRGIAQQLVARYTKTPQVASFFAKGII
jgi:hypothetical protein